MARRAVGRIALGLREMKATHGASAGGEFVHRQTHALNHADKEVGQWRVVGFVEGQVPAMLETAAGQQ